MSIEEISQKSKDEAKAEKMQAMHQDLMRRIRSQKQKTEGSVAPTAPADEGKGQVEASKQSKGVVQLLKEGHFKGVADLRLRMNHLDELAVSERVVDGRSAYQRVGDGVEAVEAEIQELFNSGQLTADEQLAIKEDFESFVAQVDQASAAWAAAEDLPSESLVTEAKGHFEAFEASIREDVSLPEVESPTDKIPPIDTTDDKLVLPVEIEESDGVAPELVIEAELDVDTMIQRLRETFLSALESKSSTTSSLQLPALSAAEGKGVAYEKFNAAYQEMLSLRGMAESAPNAPVEDAPSSDAIAGVNKLAA